MNKKILKPLYNFRLIFLDFRSIAFFPDFVIYFVELFIFYRIIHFKIIRQIFFRFETNFLLIVKLLRT